MDYPILAVERVCNDQGKIVNILIREKMTCQYLRISGCSVAPVPLESGPWRRQADDRCTAIEIYSISLAYAQVGKIELCDNRVVQVNRFCYLILTITVVDI